MAARALPVLRNHWRLVQKSIQAGQEGEGKDPFLCPLVANAAPSDHKDPGPSERFDQRPASHTRCEPIWAKHHKVRRGMEAWHRRSSCHPAASSRSSR